MKHFKAKILVDPEAVPKFSKARLVLLAICVTQPYLQVTLIWFTRAKVIYCVICVIMGWGG